MNMDMKDTLALLDSRAKELEKMLEGKQTLEIIKILISSDYGLRLSIDSNQETRNCIRKCMQEHKIEKCSVVGRILETKLDNLWKEIELMDLILRSREGSIEQGEQKNEQR